MNPRCTAISNIIGVKRAILWASGMKKENLIAFSSNLDGEPPTIEGPNLSCLAFHDAKLSDLTSYAELQF